MNPEKTLTLESKKLREMLRISLRLLLADKRLLPLTTLTSYEVIVRLHLYNDFKTYSMDESGSQYEEG